MRIIVTGLIAQHRSLGGVAWDYLNVILGLKRLGHDVYYVEDSGEWPYDFDGANSENDRVAYDPKPTVDYLATVMDEFGLRDRWAYHFPTKSRWFGLSDQSRAALIGSSDVLINVSGTLENPDKYREIKKLVYIDTDPVFTQIEAADSGSALRHRVNAHDIHFTVGECLGKQLPDTGHSWIPTKHPIVLSEWLASSPPRNMFTTVMNWTSYKPVTYRGRTYGQKDIEFAKFVSLPEKVFPSMLELALHKPEVRWSNSQQCMIDSRSSLRNHQLMPHEMLKAVGWRIVDATKVCPDFGSYRQYIQQSKGEWSVAKNGYVDGNSGWFSGRSGCYLAAGRPVIVQETGFSRVLPVGEGILAFKTLAEAEEAIREVERNYSWHAKAARGIAETYFESDKVLNRLLDIAMNSCKRGI